MRLAANRCVGEDQRRSRRDQTTDVLSKGWIYRDAMYQCLQVWRFSTDGGGGDPVAPAVGAESRISRVCIGTGYSSCFQSRGGRTPDLHAVAVYVDLAIRCSYNDRHRPGSRFFRRPERGRRRRGACLAREEQAGAYSMVWSGFVIGDDDRRSDTSCRVEVRRKIDRHSHTASGCWVARQMPGVQRDASPGESLHMRHLGTFVNA